MKPLYRIITTVLPVLLLNQLCIGTNVIYVQNAVSPPNSSVIIHVGVNNDSLFNAVQFDLLFPSELTWINDSVSLTVRADGHSVSSALIEPGRLRVVAWSSVNADFTGTSGDIVEIGFISGMDPGTYPVTIENATLSGTNSNILTGVTDGTFTLTAPKAKLSVGSIDWGRIPLLQEAYRTLAITNSGNLPLTITALDFADNRFSSSLTLPFTLAANNSVNIDIRFYSTIKGTITSNLTVYSNDPDGQQLCDLSVIAFAVNEIHIGNATGRSGYEMVIPISINNMEPFNAFQVKIKLPAVAKFIKGSDVLSTTRKVDHVVAADTLKDTLTIVAYSPSNKPFLSNDGVVMNFTLFVQGQGGSYPLSQSGSIISDSTGANSLSASYDGWIDITAPILAVSSSEIDFGNVSTLDSATTELVLFNNGNDDLIINQIDIADTAFAYYETLPFTIPPGKNKVVTLSFRAVDGLEHKTVLRIQSNDLPRDPTDVILTAKSFFPNELRVTDLIVKAGTSDTLFINLFNQSLVSGFQFDIGLPVGINPSAIGVFLTGRKADHVVMASEIDSGKLRVLSYSGSLKSFSGNSGNIIGIPIQVSAALLGTYPVDISGVVISDSIGKSIGTGYKSGNITINAANGIKSIILLSEINVYPNPITDELNINFGDETITRISLCQLNGLIVWTEEKVSSHILVNTEMLKPAMYLLIVESNKGIEVIKIIKK